MKELKVVTATQPMTLVEVYCEHGTTEVDVAFWPIIAWALEDGEEPHPIAAGHPYVTTFSDDGFRYFIELPDGMGYMRVGPAPWKTCRYRKLNDCVEAACEEFGVPYVERPPF